MAKVPSNWGSVSPRGSKDTALEVFSCEVTPPPTSQGHRKFTATGESQSAPRGPTGAGHGGTHPWGRCQLWVGGVSTELPGTQVAAKTHVGRNDGLGGCRPQRRPSACAGGVFRPAHAQEVFSTQRVRRRCISTSACAGDVLQPRSGLKLGVSRPPPWGSVV